MCEGILVGKIDERRAMVVVEVRFTVAERTDEVRLAELIVLGHGG